MASILSSISETPIAQSRVLIRKDASWQRPHQYHEIKGYCVDFVVSCDLVVQDWVAGHDYGHFHQEHPPIPVLLTPIKIHHHVLNHPHRNKRTTDRERKRICMALESQIKQYQLFHIRHIPDLSEIIVQAAEETLNIIYSMPESQRHDSFTIKADVKVMLLHLVPPVDEAPHMVPATDESIMKLERKVVMSSTSDSTGKDDCAVCLDELRVGCEAVSMPCSHMFHGKCIVAWLNTSHCCPLCRFKMPTNHANMSL